MLLQCINEVPFCAGGTAHASVASTDWTAGDIASAQRGDLDRHSVSSMPAMNPPSCYPLPSMHASTGAVSAPDLPFHIGPPMDLRECSNVPEASYGANSGNILMPSMHSALDALTMDLSDLGFSSGVGGKVKTHPQAHNASVPCVLGSSLSSSSGLGGVAHSANIWGPPSTTLVTSQQSNGNAPSPRNVLLSPNQTSFDFNTPLPPSNPQSPTAGTHDQARSFEAPVDTFSCYSSGQFSTDASVPPSQPPSSGAPNPAAPHFQQHPQPPMWGPQAYNPTQHAPLSPRGFQAPPGSRAPHWARPQPSGPMHWMPPGHGQMQYRPGPYSMHVRPVLHGPIGPIQAPPMHPGMQHNPGNGGHVPPQYPTPSHPPSMHAQMPSEATPVGPIGVNNSNMHASNAPRAPAWPQGNKSPTSFHNDGTSQHPFHSQPQAHMHASGFEQTQTQTQHPAMSSHSNTGNPTLNPPNRAPVATQAAHATPPPGIWGPFGANGNGSVTASGHSSSHQRPSGLEASSIPPSGHTGVAQHGSAVNSEPSDAMPAPHPGLGRGVQAVTPLTPGVANAREAVAQLNPGSQWGSSASPAAAESSHPAQRAAMYAGEASLQRPIDAAWSCCVCTYEHLGAEALFLTCAMCGSDRNK